jgi:hypothetical protein
MQFFQAWQAKVGSHGVRLIHSSFVVPFAFRPKRGEADENNKYIISALLQTMLLDLSLWRRQEASL